MKTLTKWIAGAATAAAMAATAAPAQAQYYDSRYDRDRTSVGEVVARVAAVAGAVLSTSQGRYYDPRYGGGYDSRYGSGYDPRYGNGYDPRYGNGYDPRYGSGYGYGYGNSNGYGNNRGLEAHAVNACTYEAQRRYARYGGARIDIRDVQYTRNDRLRVVGSVDVNSGRYGGGYGGYNDYNRGRTAFSCDVRGNGRVSSFRTHNYNW